MASEEKDESNMAEGKPKPWRLEEELKTNEKLRLEDVTAMREFCLSLPNVTASLVTDNFLAALINSGDYELEKAKNIARKHFEIRLSTPEIFANRNVDSDEIQSALEFQYSLPLRKKTPEGRQVMFQAMRQSDPALFSHVASCKVQFLTIDACLHQDPTVPGYVFVSDMSGLTMRHMFKCGIFLTRKIMKYQQEGIPLKIHQGHIINASSFTQKLMSFIKPMLSKELYELINLYTADEMDLLYEKVPKECLPKEYGGTQPDLETLREQHIKWLREMQPQVDNEDSDN